MSDFGPANAVGGVWECPDLFPLAVDGDPAKTKWVMVVNLNPGGIQGGSAGQYFVGDFDGTRFTADDAGAYTPPAGTLVAGLRGRRLTAPGRRPARAFGDGPARATCPARATSPASAGSGLANSFHDGDGAHRHADLARVHGHARLPELPRRRRRRTRMSPERRRHRRPPGTVLADFEGDTYGAWTTTGDVRRHRARPRHDGRPAGGQRLRGHGLVNTLIERRQHTGHITSPDSPSTADYLNFLVGGGNHPAGSATHRPGTRWSTAPSCAPPPVGQRGTELGRLGRRRAAGKRRGSTIVDENTGGWGHILADHIILADTPAQIPRSTETAVNLLVDGQVVRSSHRRQQRDAGLGLLGPRALTGKQAQIQIVDRNNGGWGHILADQFTFADAAAQSSEQRAHWLDYGKDYYAAVSWNDAPAASGS